MLDTRSRYWEKGRSLFSVFLFGSLFLFTLACDEEATISIPEDKLVRVLADVYIAEIAAQPYLDEEKDSILNVYYDKIYEIHGVSISELNTALDILQNNPIQMDSIYRKASEWLKEMEKNVGNEK